ncbi:MAG: hypothetical protein GXY60_01805 [Spirochaetales bacterium]|nr:hypothetical protein [Spirochaetales bacterium]
MKRSKKILLIVLIICVILIGLFMYGFVRYLSQNLHTAATSGPAWIVKLAIIGGADVNERRSKGLLSYSEPTPLLLAAEYNSDEKVIEALIEAGADARDYYESGYMTALHLAARSNPNPKVVETLIRNGAEIDARDHSELYRGATALHYAVVSNNIEVISALINAGAGVNKTDGHENTALMFAASEREDVQITKLLLEAKADTEVKNSWDETALSLATKHNQNVQIVSTLIAAGAEFSCNLLYYAADNPNPEVFKTIYESGNCKDQVHQFLSDALFNCVSNNDSDPPDTLALILSLGANVNARDNNRYRNMTPLMYAAENNDNPTVLSMLIEAGSDVNAQDYYGRTALMHAAVHPNPLSDFKIQLMTILLDAGADVSLKTTDGKTALDYARENIYRIEEHPIFLQLQVH